MMKSIIMKGALNLSGIPLCEEVWGFVVFVDSFFF